MYVHNLEKKQNKNEKEETKSALEEMMIYLCILQENLYWQKNNFS